MVEDNTLRLRPKPDIFVLGVEDSPRIPVPANNISEEMILPARRYASAGTSYGPVSVSVCVCHKSVFYRNGWTNPAGFRHGSFFPPILHCFKEI